MLFNSYIFIFLFLPLCLVGFYGLKNRQATQAKVWLTCFSLWFYGYFNVNYLLIMVCSILGNFLCHRLIVIAKKQWDRTGRYKTSGMILGAGVGLNLLVLFYFKYFDFFLENLNQWFELSFPLKNILLPLGISFFTFQQISFLADTYRGELNQCTFIDYALFVSFFPQLIAGPIVTHEEMLPQFERIGKDGRSRDEKAEIFIKGIYVFVIGLAKKVLIADTFGIAVDQAYSNVSALNGLESLITILFYSLQLYFDFSGYCDMAKGIAGMFGMTIATNFHSPYKAVNIVDFWKRWHITLSRFFTKNIYIPLGGNRKGMARMYCNLFIVFFLSGLWHGAGWNYILWGVMHGVLYVITRWWQIENKKRALLNEEEMGTENDTGKELVYSKTGEIGQKSVFMKKIWHAIKRSICRILTFSYVSIAWVYFRAASIGQANTLLTQAVTKEWAVPGSGILDAFNLGEFWYVLKIFGVTNLPYSGCYLMILITLFTVIVTFVGKNAGELAVKFKPTVWNACITAVLFIWCVVSLSGVSTFLYFNF